MKAKLNTAARLGQIGLCLAAPLAGVAVSGADVDISKLPPTAAVQIDFARDVKPILETTCLRCHGPEKPKSKFRLDNREAALKGGEGGVDILPGNSAKSHLILYTAYLVEDMEMPPIGKGRQLTARQVSLLRAWIDQGALWDNAARSNQVELTLAPVFGGTTVSGDNHKYREQYWQKDGLNGGLEKLEMFDQTRPDTKTVVDGHVLLDDYSIALTVDRADLGFIHSGWQQYRKYFDDTGGYEPGLLESAPRLGEDLHLDIGKAWIDLGLTLPDWPRMTLGYEYDYRQGDKATTEWNTVGGGNNARNIGPASEAINEGVHIIKFDLDDDIKGVRIEERFRGEFYNFKTASSNTVLSQGPQIVNEGTTYFQGANTIRLEKKFDDWLFGSAGYLYSKLNADSTFRLDDTTLLEQAAIPRITLEKESHVANLNGLIGPFDGLSISTGAQAEWSRQEGMGAGIVEQQITTVPVSNSIVPFNVASDYEESSFQESLALRYSKIPFTGLFAEARLEQQSIGQSDQFSAAQDILNKAVFQQQTEFSSQSSDLRVGFNTSPWRTVSFSAHYRRYEDDSHYDSAPLIQPVVTAYPTFIRARDLLTDEIETKLVLHPTPRVQTTITYQYDTTDYHVTTAPYVSFGNVISPGGQLLAGEEHSQTVSISTTLTPTRRVYFTPAFSYQTSETDTAADASPAVVPYRGDVYSLTASATYVLTRTSQLFTGYAFSDADYAQHNFAGGLPLGIDYERQSVQAGLSRRFGTNVSVKLQYRFDSYNEPSSGGAPNYRAHSVFLTLTCKLP